MPNPPKATKQYYYLHEEMEATYVVSVKPPPADTSEVVFRKRTKKGPAVLKKDLVKDGTSTVTFEPGKNGVLVTDSPIWAMFAFKKNAFYRPNARAELAISIAEPAVALIEVPQDAKRDDDVTLKVTSWVALAYDRPGMKPNRFREKDLTRIDQKAKDGVTWEVAGKLLDGKKGETITTKLALDEAAVGKSVIVRAEAHRDDGQSTGWVHAQIAIPKVTITLAAGGPVPDTIHIGQRLSLRATVEPWIEGTWKWTVGDKLQIVGADDAAAVVLEGKSDGENVSLKAEITSKATSKKYDDEKKIKVRYCFVEFVIQDQFGNAVSGLKHVFTKPDGTKGAPTALLETGKFKDDRVLPGTFKFALQLLSAAAWGEVPVLLDKKVALAAKAPGFDKDAQGSFEVFDSESVDKAALATVTGKVDEKGVLAGEWTPSKGELDGKVKHGFLVFIAKIGDLPRAISPLARVCSKDELELKDKNGPLAAQQVRVHLSDGTFRDVTTGGDGKAELLLPLGLKIAWFELPPEDAGAHVTLEDADGTHEFVAAES